MIKFEEDDTGVYWITNTLYPKRSSGSLGKMNNEEAEYCFYPLWGNYPFTQDELECVLDKLKELNGGSTEEYPGWARWKATDGDGEVMVCVCKPVQSKMGNWWVYSGRITTISTNNPVCKNWKDTLEELK